MSRNYSQGEDGQVHARYAQEKHSRETRLRLSTELAKTNGQLGSKTVQKGHGRAIVARKRAIREKKMEIR